MAGQGGTPAMRGGWEVEGAGGAVLQPQRDSRRQPECRPGSQGPEENRSRNQGKEGL